MTDLVRIPQPVLEGEHPSVRWTLPPRVAGGVQKIVAHPAGCAEVEVTLDISARAGAAEGFPDRVVQIVRENGRQSGFTANEFEGE